MSSTSPGLPVSASASTATRAVAVDAACPNLAAVEHLAHRVASALEGVLDEESYVLSSHVVQQPARFAAVLTWWDGPAPDEVAAVLATGLPDLADVDGRLVADPDLAATLPTAVEEAISRSAGRLMRYPGRTAVEQRTTAAAVVAASCVDAVEGLAGVTVTPDAVLDLTGFARPTWRAGRCTLLVQQSRDALVPFEAREQIPCCSDH